MTKQKHSKAIDAASNAEELLPLEQMMSQGSASSEGAVHAVDDTHQVTDSEHQGTEGESAYLVPKLRFKTANDSSYCNWEITTLGALGYVAMCKRVFKHQTSTEIAVPFFKIGTFGEIPDAYISRELFLELRDRYPFPKMGAVLLSASGTIGRQVIYDGSDAYFQDSNIVWLEHNALVRDDFLAPFYLRTKWQGLEGSTIKRLYNKIILSQPITLPCVAEQQRIGALFKELDHNIELNRGLLEKLIQLKKSMLEQMFPREGESVPRLRFAGFTEPWKTESFEQVFCYLPQINTSRDKLSISNGCVKTIHYGDILTIFGEVLDVSSGAVPRIIDSKPLDRDSPYLLRDGDILIVNTAEDSLAGKALEVVGISEEQVVGGLCTIPCRPHCMFAKSFLGYLLNAPAFRAKCVSLLQGTKVFHINKELLASVVVCYPIDIAEQQRIGEFFKALDQRITQQRAKLEKLGQLKKALLEQMFV